MRRYQLHVMRCDNQLVVIINNDEVYRESYQGDPDLHDRVDITDKLQGSGYVNRVRAIGTNGAYDADPNAPNPWHFVFEITWQDLDVNEHIHRLLEVRVPPERPQFAPPRTVVHDVTYDVVLPY